MSIRDDIAAAVSTVEGVNVTAHYRQTLHPGQGFVRLGNSVRSDNGFGFVDTFEVWLALPQDVAAAERWLEERKGEIADALEEAVYVTGVQPSELVIGSSTVNGVIFTGTTPA